MSSTKSNSSEIPENRSRKTVEPDDYLTEDPVLSEQQYVCISFLKPSSVDKKKRKDITVCGIKIRGVYATEEEARKRADYLVKMDPYHNIYVGNVGKWLPFEDNPEKAKDSNYMNSELNRLMKAYNKQQDEAKMFHELRKQDETRKATEEANKKKIKNEKQKKTEMLNKLDHQEDENIKQTVEQENVDNVDNVENVENVDNSDLDNLKDVSEQQKLELDQEKEEINRSINKIRELERELDARVKEMEREQNKN
jgi:hypothetical protein